MFKQAKDSAQPFDSVIPDLTIPGGMGGRKTVKRLLEIGSELKAVVSIGYSNDPGLANFRDLWLNSKTSFHCMTGLISTVTCTRPSISFKSPL